MYVYVCAVRALSTPVVEKDKKFVFFFLNSFSTIVRTFRIVFDCSPFLHKHARSRHIYRLVKVVYVFFCLFVLFAK